MKSPITFWLLVLFFCCNTITAQSNVKHAEPARIYTHDCINEKKQLISDSKAFSADEDIVAKYEKITKKSPVIFNEVNGNRVCSVFYFSMEDRVVHRGDFTEYQLSQIKAYKFQRLEDCLLLLQMVQELDLRVQDANLKENEVHVRSNITRVEIRTIEESLFLGKSQAIDFYYSFEKLKNKYLTISLKHPLCKDTVVEIDKRGRFVFVRMQFTSEFLREEFVELKVKSDFQLLRALQAITMDEKLYGIIGSCADSIEIDYCLKQGSGAAIEKFITDRPYSLRYQDALKVRQYYKDAEAKYASVKAANTIKEYEYFLKNFGLSNHKDEIKQLLVAEAVRYYSKDVGLSDSLLLCYNRYVVPNQGETWIEQYNKSIMTNMETALIAENKSSTIEQHAGHWKKILMFEQGIKVKMNSYRNTFREPLCNLYFEQLKKVSSAASQDSLVASFKANFDSFEAWADGKNDSEDFINHVMTKTKNKNGSVNLFNSAFLLNYLVSNVAAFSMEYKYKGNSYALKKVSDKASMVWANNNLIGELITYEKGQIESKTIFTSFPYCDLTSIFQNGNLTVEKHYKNGALEFFYEFENGTNISINALSQLLNQADKLFSEKKLEEAGALYKSAKNTYPADLPVNVKLATSLAKFNAVWEKHLAEKRAEEEAAAKRQKSVADANEMRTKHGKVIKEKIIAAYTIASLYGEERGQIEWDKAISETQNDLIHRKFTNEDILVFNSIVKEARAVFNGYVNIWNQNAENDKKEKKCTFCDKVFTGPSWYPRKDEIDNSCSAYELSYNGFGSGVDRCCSYEHAVKKCKHD